VFGLRIDDDSSLHLLEERHAEELFALTDANRAYLRQWLPWLDQVVAVADTRAFIQSTLRQFADNNGFQTALRHQGRIVGMVGLHYVQWLNRCTSFGYWLAEAHQGRGLVTRACAALLDHVFGTLGLNHVEIQCAAGNARSRAIPERLGFRQEGLLRQREWLYDHFVDHVAYGLLASEWRERKPASV
jgi:ribosomal-protein-serine acetyltransferase